MYKYYLGVLAQGAQPEGSLERQDYDKLRASLAGDTLAARLYGKWLTAFLDWIERFFGDVGMADRTLFPQAFGLKKPASLWTAPAFDRCLLLALIYPFATIFVIWAVSGHVGPAERALGLKPDNSGWVRSLWVGATIVLGFILWIFARIRGRRPSAWSAVAIFVGGGVIGAGIIASILAGAVAIAIATGVAGAIGIEIVVAGADARADVSGPVAGVGAVAILGASAGAGAISSYSHASGVGAIGIAIVMASAWAVTLLSNVAVKHRWHGVFLSLFLPVMISECLGLAVELSSLKSWEVIGPFLLFLGLLTLLNAPFDWASLGLTRALLRRGLELGGWWPYLLALVDAALAGVIIALLALTMVVGVQAFDELAVHGGGKPVLPLDTVFDGIAKNPAAPEYWWAYALLLSSMIPSLINLAIGGMAFTRGIPWLARLILNWIPEGKAVPEYKRQPAAIGLTVQMFAGAGLGIAAQAFLAWGLIFHLMPWIGLDVLDMARAVAAFDLPARVAKLFASFV
jgi:hypothetical protein